MRIWAELDWLDQGQPELGLWFDWNWFAQGNNPFDLLSKRVSEAYCLIDMLCMKILFWYVGYVDECVIGWVGLWLDQMEIYTTQPQLGWVGAETCKSKEEIIAKCNDSSLKGNTIYVISVWQLEFTEDEMIQML